MGIKQPKSLKFLQAILTGKERKWLQSSKHDSAMRYRRLNFLLDGFPGDKKIESMMAWSLVGVISDKLAYKEG